MRRGSKVPPEALAHNGKEPLCKPCSRCRGRRRTCSDCWLLAVGTIVLTNTSPAPSHHVTPSGQYLYEFEALLHQTFGTYNIVICGAIRPATACHYGWFYNAATLHVPNELLLGYAFTFTNLRSGTLHRCQRGSA